MAERDICESFLMEHYATKLNGPSRFWSDQLLKCVEMRFRRSLQPTLVRRYPNGWGADYLGPDGETVFGVPNGMDPALVWRLFAGTALQRYQDGLAADAAHYDEGE